MQLTDEDIKELVNNVQTMKELGNEAFETVNKLQLENDILRKMLDGVKAENEMLRRKQTAPVETTIEKLFPECNAAFPKGRWT